jgi:tetratricopeptide (TPR) repeat protein
VYRIFVVGGSAAQGMPDQSFAFCRVLKVMLETAYPQRRFEVINAAMTAINSHVVREIVRDCADFEPDLFVVYMGNNEVVGPYGPGTVFAGFLDNQSMIRLSIMVRRLRLAQLTERIAAALAKQQAWRGMEMFVPHRVPAHDPRLQSTYEHFRENLKDIIHAAQSAGAEIVLCTIATNLKDCPPFASTHRPDISTDQLAQWQLAFDRDDYTQAVVIDNTHAKLCFRLGREYLEAGEQDQAKQYFIQARDMDALRFRADSQINQILREVGGADSSEVHLADVENDLAEQSQIIGRQWLYEHVHFNFAGNYQVAKSIFDQMQGLLGPPSATLPDVNECAAQLSLTDWHRWKLASLMLEMTSRPPFSLQLDHEADQMRQTQYIKTLHEQLDDLTVVKRMITEAMGALKQRPDDLQIMRQSALLLSHGGYNDQAASMWQNMLEQVPGWAPWQGELGKVLSVLNRNDQAVEVLEQAVSIMPYDTGLLTNLGVTLMKADRLEEAEKVLQRSLAFEPDHIATLNNLGLLLASFGRYDEAMVLYQHALELEPNNVNMHCSLGVLYNDIGDKAKAIEHLKKALTLQPDHKMATESLMQIRIDN